MKRVNANCVHGSPIDEQFVYTSLQWAGVNALDGNSDDNAVNVRVLDRNGVGSAGTNNEQQSWSGKIEVSKVPSRRASLIISFLSIPINGRRIGCTAARSIIIMFSSVCEATWPRLSPVINTWEPIFAARALAILIITRR